jgi:hypothetical protein
VVAEIDEIAALTAQIETTSHTGRRNRLIDLRGRVLDAIDASPERSAMLRALLAHPRPSVRMVAAWRCGWRHVETQESERVVTALAEGGGAFSGDAKRWLESRERMAAYRPEAPMREALAYEPPPKGCSFEAADAFIAGAVSPKRARALVPLLRRSIRLWPRAHGGDPRASCLGGLPGLPPGYAWPTFEDEPRLFLGQINCAEIHAAIGDNPLPPQGLLQFYGDHDEVYGCGPMDSGATLFFPDPGALQPAAAPIAGFLELPRCGLDAIATVELPHPKSETIADLAFSPAEQKAYCDLRAKLAALNGPAQWPEFGSKIFGWPDLIQRDLGDDCGEPGAGAALLLQIGWFHDGAKSECWGPGGLVYFILNEEAIVAGRFEGAAMEMQCT